MRRYTIPEVRAYVEPLLDQATKDSWHGDYGYIYGWKGNPIIAAILQLRGESEEKTTRIKELERDLGFYKERYTEAANNAKGFLGV